MRPNAVVSAIGQYLTTTTLHGFKYLYSPYVADRLVWLLSCCASASCAGVLCAVLWSRFTSVPNLLSLRTSNACVDMPRFGFCLPPRALAKRVVMQEFGANYTHLANPLAKSLLGQDSSDYKLAHLDFLLKSRNITLGDALMKHSPACDGVIMKCRVGGLMVDCERLVKKELIPYGVCCVVDVLSMKVNPQDEPEKTLELVIETPPQEYTFLDLYARYQGKGWVLLTTLTPEHFYTGYLWFQYILGSETERPAGEVSCDDDEGYSRVKCLRHCAEEQCGCSDPLVNRSIRKNECSITRLACLRTSFTSASIRSLLSYFRKVGNFSTWVWAWFSNGLIGSKAIVLSISLKTSGSQIFVRMPTETWLTLLSSLGGVFNMFIGVGLFSALELIYFLLVRLPIAIKKSREIEISSNADTNM